MLPNSYYVKPCQFSRQPSVITDQRSKWLQPSVKKIVGIKKNSSIENPLVEIPFQINFQQDSGCDLSYSHRTTARNKENIIYRPKWQPSQQSQRSTTPINQKKTEIKIMNTRGCGSVSPLRQRQTSCFKIAEPQLQDMVDNLKQNILRDIQEVTRKYQSSRSPTPLSKQISRETIYNVKPPFNSAYELPFQSNTTRQIPQNTAQQKTRYTQDKQKDLLKQQLLEQQSLQLVEQLKQSTLKKPDDHRISFNNSYKFQIDHEQVMKNIQTFYQEVQKKQQLELPSPFTQLTDEEEHSRSQITINNLSSIIPGLQSKKINVSFESSNQDLQSDCRNTFGPLQLECAIKDSKIRLSSEKNLTFIQPQDSEQSLSEISDDYEKESRMTKITETFNKLPVPIQNFQMNELKFDITSKQSISTQPKVQDIITTELKDENLKFNSQFADILNEQESDSQITPAQQFKPQEQHQKTNLNIEQLKQQQQGQTTFKEFNINPEGTQEPNTPARQVDNGINDRSFQETIDFENRQGQMQTLQDNKQLGQNLIFSPNRANVSTKNGSAKRYEACSEIAVEPLSSKSNRYDQLIQNFQSIKQQNKQTNFVLETKKSMQIGECSHISDFIIHSHNRESIKQDSVFQQLNILQPNQIQPTLQINTTNNPINLVESIKFKNQRTTSFSDFLKTTKQDKEQTTSVSSEQSILSVKPPGISKQLQLSIGFLQYKEQVTN